MNQELEKLQSLLHIPYDTNRFDILLHYLCITETQTKIKKSDIPLCISYSIDDEIVDSLFTNIENPQLLYEYYYCDTDLFKENQIYSWKYKNKYVLFSYDAINVSSYDYDFHYTIELLPSDDIVKKIDRSRFTLDTKTKIIQRFRLLEDSDEYWRGIRIS